MLQKYQQNEFQQILKNLRKSSDSSTHSYSLTHSRKHTNILVAYV